MHEPAQVLALAHDLQPEPLRGRRRWIGRGVHDGRTAVLVEEVRDRHHALDPGIPLLHRIERRRKPHEVHTAGIDDGSGTQRRGHASDQRRGGIQHRDPLRTEYLFAELQGVSSLLGSLQHVGEVRVVLHARDAAQGTHAAEHITGRVAIGRAGGEQLQPRADVRGFGGEVAVVPGRGGAGDRRGEPRRGMTDQLVDPRAGTHLVGIAPRAHVAQQQLAIIDAGNEDSANLCIPWQGALAERAADTLHAGRHRRECRKLRHRRTAAQRARRALERLAVDGAGRAGEEVRVELLDVIARFENEEVEKSDGGRSRHAGAGLVGEEARCMLGRS